MKNDAVKVRREAIEKCMKCSLCNQLFTDATTICECLHTFCKECISKKLSDEELEFCPKCEADLGSVPMHKLRPDPSMQELIEKIFASKKRKINTPENVPSASATTSEVSTESSNTSNSSEGEMNIRSYISNIMNSLGLTISPEFLNILVAAASTIQVLENRCYRLSAKNQKLKADLATSKAATSALSDVKRRLKSKEAEVVELHKKCDNFCLGISNVENVLEKLKQSISK